MNENNTDRFVVDNPHLKDNPYTLPDGYFDALEENVRLRIHRSDEDSQQGVFVSVKSYLMLAFSFIIIFGIGYGVISLTPALDKSGLSLDDNITALIEEGYINGRFVDYLYDDIVVDRSSMETVLILPDNITDRIEESISEYELMEYLTNESLSD